MRHARWVLFTVAVSCGVALAFIVSRVAESQPVTTWVRRSGDFMWGPLKQASVVTPQFEGMDTTVPMWFQADISAASATATTPAFRMQPSTALDATDLIFEVRNSAATSLLSLDQSGLFTLGGSGSNLVSGNLDVRGTIFNGGAANNGEVAFADDIRCTSTTTTCQVRSPITAASATATNPAVGIRPAVTLDAADAMFAVTNFGGTQQFSVAENGNAIVAGTLTSGNGSANYFTISGAAATVTPSVSVANSGDANTGINLIGKGTGALGYQSGSGQVMTVTSTGIFAAWSSVRAGYGSANYVSIAGSATGSPVSITAVGGDANLGLNLVGNGTGSLNWDAGKMIIDSNGNSTFAGTATIGGGTAIVSVLSTTASIDFGATAANTCEESAAITLTGAVVGNAAQCGTPAAPAANSNIFCYVSAADAVRVRRCNVSVAALADPAAETYRIAVTKF